MSNETNKVMSEERDMITDEELLNRYEVLVEHLLDSLDADEQFDTWNEARKKADDIRKARFSRG